MKVRMTFKCPDAMEYATDCDTGDDVNEDHPEYDEFKELAERFVTYSEYITVEFDTEAGTCVVVER